MKAHPTIRSAIEKRITLALSKGAKLQPGRGDQAARVFDVWSAVVERLPFFSFLETGFDSVFTGWHPVEVLADRAPQRIESAEVRMPRDLVAAENHHFSFTLGRDLVVKPPGRISDWKIWRLSSLGARLKWALFQQGTAMPYGESILGYLTVAHYVSTILRDVGVIQLRRGAGIPVVEEKAGASGLQGAKERETQGEAATSDNVTTTLQDFIDTLDGTGVIKVPRGWSFGFESVQGVFEGWVKVFQWDADTLNSAILGGNLLGQISGASGSRAAGEVQLQVSIAQARTDARKVAELVRRRLFWPWTALNASAFGFPTASLSPSLDDVPLEALPRIEFPNLRRPNLELLAILLDKVRLKPELADKFRLNLDTIADDGDLERLLEGQDGPFPDLARQPPPDFGGGNAPPPSSQEDGAGEGSDVEDETGDARDDRPNRSRS